MVRQEIDVAPVRERGLKYMSVVFPMIFICRSRKGAWIEMPITLAILLISYGRSRKGAWIEMPITLAILLISYGRSRKGAWIEIGPHSRF